MRSVARFALAAFIACAGPRTVAAQSTLTVTGGPVSFAAPTPADFVAGSLAATAPVTFEVAPGSSARVTTVTIRAAAPTMGGSKPVADLQWRRGDAGVWHSLSESDVEIESKTFTPGANPPWQNTIYFRVLLNWTSDSPASYLADFVITLTQSL